MTCMIRLYKRVGWQQTHTFREIHASIAGQGGQPRRSGIKDEGEKIHGGVEYGIEEES